MRYIPAQRRFFGAVVTVRGAVCLGVAASVAVGVAVAFGVAKADWR